MEIPGYDKNGDIIQLRRRYEGADMDKLTYLYNEASNKLKKIEEKATGSFAIPNYSLASPRSYTYDVNGNMTYAPSMNKYITYNDLNLPESVGGLYTGKSFYHYGASGTKLAKSIETADGAIGDVTSYVGNLIFEGNNLAFVLHSEGRLVPDEEGKWNYEYNMKDHLGNTRAVIAGSIMGGKVDLIQESHYYPFGLSFKTRDYSSIGNKFLFNGKELQEETGWYDFGARHQDRIIGRWHVIDPLAVFMPGVSPYNYCYNNPISLVDNYGMWGDENKKKKRRLKRSQRKRRRQMRRAIRKRNRRWNTGGKNYNPSFKHVEAHKPGFMWKHAQSPNSPINIIEDNTPFEDDLIVQDIPNVPDTPIKPNPRVPFRGRVISSGQTYSFDEQVDFEVASARITKPYEMAQLLEDLIITLEDHAQLQVSIQGNLYLSSLTNPTSDVSRVGNGLASFAQRRANAIKAYLISRGISENRIKTAFGKAYGDRTKGTKVTFSIINP